MHGGRLVHFLRGGYPVRAGRSRRHRRRGHAKRRVHHQIGDGHQTGVHIEREGTLIPGGVVRSHCVLVINHGFHIHSRFGWIEKIIVTPTAVLA